MLDVRGDLESDVVLLVLPDEQPGPMIRGIKRSSSLSLPGGCVPATRTLRSKSPLISRRMPRRVHATDLGAENMGLARDDDPDLVFTRLELELTIAVGVDGIPPRPLLSRWSVMALRRSPLVGDARGQVCRRASFPQLGATFSAGCSLSWETSAPCEADQVWSRLWNSGASGHRRERLSLRRHHDRPADAS